MIPPALPNVPLAYANRPPRTSLLAIWSLIMGLLSLCGGLPGVLAVIFGHKGRSNIRRSGGALTGDGLCLAGLILGYTGMVIGTAAIIVICLSASGFGYAMQKMEAESKALFPLAETPVPSFPALSEFQAVDPDSKVKVAQVTLQPVGKAMPGAGMSLRVYLPEHSDKPKSLACVFVAPAGTNLLAGNSLDRLDEDAYHLECLPYAEAGMAVVLYSLDGEAADPGAGEGDQGAMKAAFMAFKAAGAGTLNARNALEFALARLPMIDPGRLYAAGHSSAGTLALLFAAHEPRLRGCLAYAPAGDLEVHFSSTLKDAVSGISSATALSSMNLVLPGFTRFIKRSSPLTHLERITMPVFLFQAKDDENVEFATAKAFADACKAKSLRVTFATVDEGGHYDSMIDEGIPQGIDWIQNLELKAN